ncbi:hypothetical protein AMJ83_11195 [candidate division WOR_3 bacterium SM23_42]|uniref:Metallo-beta-lactamase domain-containing protein n=1 Tax=candidate division WOR_3 bacterium SM23_42 TaxID=1703779 RepID=A0A0S8FQD2_UNCW3|nr:MAG: hypothetical protein AMJ83_11195 [candidate division WOR_3 bacterium SM23_42]
MARIRWYDNSDCYVWLFNVGRGLSAFIKTPLNQGIIVDLGASRDYSPQEFIAREILPHLDLYRQLYDDGDYKDFKIAQVIISHPHVDHFNNIDMLFPLESSNPFQPALLTCPHSHGEAPDEALNWARIKNYPESKEKERLYRESYKKRNPPLQTIQFHAGYTVQDFEYGIYYIPPPICEEIYPNDNDSDNVKYGNATSLVLFLRYGKNTILFPGDMPPESMSYLLSEGRGVQKRYTRFNPNFKDSHPKWHEETSDQPSLKACLETYGLSILIAPHHGLESGYSSELYQCIKTGKPMLVLISEKRHKTDHNGSVDDKYRSGAHGLSIDVEGKTEPYCSFSTANNKHILVKFNGYDAPTVYAREKDMNLLDK